MSEVKFKVGDLVYCSAYSASVCQIKNIENSYKVVSLRSNQLIIDFFDCGFDFTGDKQEIKFVGIKDSLCLLCHATQENYELLSKLYPNVAFEPPPKKKEPREIIEVMLESGYAYVACRVGDYKEDFDYVSLIHCIDDTNSYPFIGDSEWRYANPFDPKTGKNIIDFVDGEVVLEGEHE